MKYPGRDHSHCSQVTTVLLRDSGTRQSAANTAGWSSLSDSETERLPSLSTLTSKSSLTSSASQCVLFSCRVKIEEDDERFSVEKLEKGERRLIIKKVIAPLWFCVLRTDEK